MKLFYNPASPFVRKVLIVASECGLADQIEKYVLGLTPVNSNDDLNTQNPLGKIPALVLEDGTTLCDSRVICEYLSSQGNGHLYPADENRWQAQRLQAIGDGMCDAAVAVRYETFVRPAQHQWEDWVEGQKGKFRRALATLEIELPQFSDRFDIGTIAVAIALDYLDFRYSDEGWRDDYPNLAQWHQAFVKRPSFEQTVPHDLKT